MKVIKRIFIILSILFGLAALGVVAFIFGYHYISLTFHTGGRNNNVLNVFNHAAANNMSFNYADMKISELIGDTSNNSYGIRSDVYTWIESLNLKEDQKKYLLYLGSYYNSFYDLNIAEDHSRAQFFWQNLTDYELCYYNQFQGEEKEFNYPSDLKYQMMNTPKRVYVYLEFEKRMKVSAWEGGVDNPEEDCPPLLKLPVNVLDKMVSHHKPL